MTDPSVEPADINAATLADLAERIKSEIRLVDSSMRESVRHAIAAGGFLTQAKDKVPYGGWLLWLKDNAICSDRTARLYMQAFHRYGGESENGNTVAGLPLRELFAVHGYKPASELVEMPSDLHKCPPVADVAVSRLGDQWLLGQHRVRCGDATSAEGVARLLDGRKPELMVTDPPYGVDMDLTWRARAGLNKYPTTPEHMTGSIPGDKRHEWSEAFALVPSLSVVYVFCASKFTDEVLAGLRRIGFKNREKIIWDKKQPALTRTHYACQHEEMCYIRKKNAPWYGTRGENSTIWTATSPKVKGSHEKKFDHPNQKPLELIRLPLVNHTRPGELVYDPFLGSGTTLIAAEMADRICCGIEIHPKYCDMIVRRWEDLTHQQATLDGDGRTFAEISQERLDQTANPSSPLAVDHLAAAS